MDEQDRKLAEELLFSGRKEPSFAKMLYFGILESSFIFPYPPKDNIEAYLAKVNVYLDRELDPVAIDRQASIPETVIRGLGDLGVLGMTIPKEFGGLGLSQDAYCQVTEAVARRCGATALFINAHQSIGLKALLLFGTDKQKEQWLKPLAKGEALAAFALTEPNAGSDANGIETRAEFDPVKRVYRINGKKQWITNGSLAKVLTVMAKTDGKVTAFLVTPDMPGFEITQPSLEKVGMRGSVTANLAFHDMEVPEENILGPLGGGLKVCLTVLDYGRTTFGATCTGAAKFLVEKAIQHAKTRIQFKKPLTHFALVKKKIARMAALAYAMDATTYLTAGFVDRKVEDFMLESAMLKVFASDSLWEILYDTMQIFGGRSFFTDEPYERMMRDARLNMIGEGSNEVMRAFIGAVGLRDVGIQLKTFMGALSDPFNQYSNLSKFFKQRWKALKRSQIPVQSSLLRKEAEALGKAVRDFGNAVLTVLAKYREEVVDKQLDLNRLAAAAMAIYTSMAVLSKMDSELTQGNQDNIAVGKLYCKMASKKVQRCLHELFDEEDAMLEKVSDQLTKS
jgi:alkylation response protein AidB-like acyl-CoA dehydrogenase